MDKVQINFHVSPDERELIRGMAGGNMSAFLRALVLAEADRRGEAIPAERVTDTRATHGGLNKEKK